MGSHEGAPVLPSRGSNPLKADWQMHVLASSGYLELGMFDDAALALEEIKPEDRTRTEVLGASVILDIAANETWTPGSRSCGELVICSAGQMLAWRAASILSASALKPALVG